MATELTIPLPCSLKPALRQAVLAQRAQLSDAQRDLANAEITQRLRDFPDYQQAHTVLAYMNFGTECSTERWVQQVLADGKKLALPRVNPATKQLDLYWVNDLENQLAVGSWGIVEPIVSRCERLTHLNEVELALLPGVAFTRKGARLGYGGGYYDKLLARFAYRPTLVSAAFALQIVADVPQEVTDVKVEWLITEQETLHCAA
jgi:5-formyltetrahydrofolate cyclo-ligase